MEYKLTFKNYTEALKENKLLGLKCNECGTISIPPKMTCRECSSTDMDIAELSGTGKVQTFTTIFVPPEGREAECPSVMGLIELDEGAWMTGNIIGVDPAKASMDLIGRKVKAGHKVLPGAKYSAGEMVSPTFDLVD